VGGLGKYETVHFENPAANPLDARRQLQDGLQQAVLFDAGFQRTLKLIPYTKADGFAVFFVSV